MCERERQIAEDRAAAAAEPSPTSTIGKGWRILSTGARVLSNAASNAKAAVEDKLRADHVERQRGKFVAHFGQEAGRDRLMATYYATALCGVGTALGGKLFITDRTACWVERRPPPAAGERPNPAPIAKFAADFRNVASLVLGEFNGEQTVGICFTSGHVLLLLVLGSGAATAVGSVLTATVTGTPAERCYNWLDHMWRACVHVPASVPMPPQTLPLPTAQAQSMPGPMQPNVSTAMPRSAPTPPGAAASVTATTSEAKGSADASDETTLCAICLDAPRNSFLRPCGHVALCMDCARRMTECPLCRARIQDVFQAFL
jgi:hypothetical protein